MTKRRKLSSAGLALVALIGLGVFVTRSLASPSSVDEAIAILEDEDRFENTTDAGAAFVRMSSLLLEAGASCEEHDGSDDETCADMFAGAAYARVTAYAMLECSRPGINDARTDALDYLHDLDAGRDAELPAAPDCT